MNALPQELIPTIFSNLGLFDLNRCSRACRQWKDAAETSLKRYTARSLEELNERVQTFISSLQFGQARRFHCVFLSDSQAKLEITFLTTSNIPIKSPIYVFHERVFFLEKLPQAEFFSLFQNTSFQVFLDAKMAPYFGQSVIYTASLPSEEYSQNFYQQLIDKLDSIRVKCITHDLA